VTPSLLILLMLGFSILPGSANFWAGFAAVTLGLPLIINFLEQVRKRMKYDRIKRYTPGFFGLKSSLYQFLLSVIFLPYQAARMLDAIFVTLFRVCVSKKNMLEWVTSADVEKSQSGSLRSYLASMVQSIALGVVIFLFASFFRPEGLFAGLVLVAVWIAAPFIAYHISREDDHDEEKLAAGDPSNAQWQRDLMVSHAKLGEVAARAGDKAAARREFSAGLTIMERLCRLDPTNATWRTDAEWLRAQLRN
jgi:hypothetical protein